MVTYYNKAELLQFANYVLTSRKLPIKFAIKVNADMDLTELAKFIKETKALTHKSDNGELAKALTGSGAWIFYQGHERLRPLAWAIAPDASFSYEENQHKVLSYTELRAALSAQNVPLLTQDDLDTWLRNEKCIAFLPKIETAPKP